MKNITVTLFCYLLSISYYALGYELETHENISQQAAKQSVLQNDQNVLQNIGMQPWETSKDDILAG